MPTTNVDHAVPALLDARDEAGLVSSPFFSGAATSGRVIADHDRRHRGLGVEAALLRLEGLEVGLALRQLALERDDVAELGRAAEEEAQLVDRLLERS